MIPEFLFDTLHDLMIEYPDREECRDQIEKELNLQGYRNCSDCGLNHPLTLDQALHEMKDLGEVESGFGDKESGDMTVINIPTKSFNKIFNLPENTEH